MTTDRKVASSGGGEARENLDVLVDRVVERRAEAEEAAAVCAMRDLVYKESADAGSGGGLFEISKIGFFVNKNRASSPSPGRVAQGGQ